MDAKKRILIGAIGGITPYILTLLVIDFETSLSGFNLYDGIGLTIRCIVLIFLGAFVAYLHQKESEPFKVFQLGLWAPALIATAINGYSQPGMTTGPTEAVPVAAIIQSIEQPNPGLSLISCAYADEPDEKPEINMTFHNLKFIKEPAVSKTSRFLRGFVGKSVKESDSKNFLLAGLHNNIAEAKKQAEELKNLGYASKVYQPYGSMQKYTVAIGTNLSLTEITELKKKVKEDNLPYETKVWKY